MKFIRGYPETMRKSIDNVNKTRSKRVNEVIADMTLEERDKLLKNFHPDYKKETKNNIAWGLNKGDLVPVEVSSILNAYPTIIPDTVDLSKVDYDIVVFVQEHFWVFFFGHVLLVREF